MSKLTLRLVQFLGAGILLAGVSTGSRVNGGAPASPAPAAAAAATSGLVTLWVGDSRASTFDFLNGVYGIRALIPTRSVTPLTASRIRDAYGGFSIVLLDRDDSAHWRRQAERNRAFLRELRALGPELLVEHRAQSGEHLRVYRIRP